MSILFILLSASSTARPVAGEERPVVKIPIELQITPEMSPSVRVLLYYVRPDKETVAASATINVQQCTANQVLSLLY